MLTVADFEPRSLDRLGLHYECKLRLCEPDVPIPGSYWGTPEAGLILNQVYAAPNTPIHSLLHELSHHICMTSDRRRVLHTDASGSDFEECAVCFLQVCIAEHELGIEPDRMFADLDAWGYSFRLGCAASWYEGDANDERNWLISQGLLSTQFKPTGMLRR